MEERIIDDEIGRGIRLKKTKDGYIDVTDELAPDTEEEMDEAEEISVILPELDEDNSGLENAAPVFVTPVSHNETDDEDLVDLPPEEAERIRKEKAEAIRRKKEAYKNACKEGETLLQTGSFRAAELVYEKALKLDDLATEASVGYWRAKTENFTDPDVFIEDYLDDGAEELEYDLGFMAMDVIKRDYRAAFEKRLGELCEQEAPLVEIVKERQETRREVLSKRRKTTGIAFLCAAVPFIGLLIAAIIVGLQNFSTPDSTFIMPTIVLGCLAFAAFIASLAVTNKFFNACRMYNMNENLSYTDEGKAILEIRQYKKIYEALLFVPQETEEEDEIE